MARYTGPVCKLCRREGVKLFLKGERCYSAKCAIEKARPAPGMHGQKRARRASDYGVRLREKQKLRRLYGMTEAQFANTFRQAVKARGVTGSVFLAMLESRLDSVVYRMGLAVSRAQARQLINHGHVRVNGRKVDIPSYQVKDSDEISLSPKGRRLDSVLSTVEANRRKKVSPWIEFNPETLTGRFLRMPAREDLVIPVNEQLIIEYYSR